MRQSNARFSGTKWMNDGEQNRRVQLADVETFLTNGFMLGKISRVNENGPVCTYCGENPLKRNAKKYCSRLCANRAFLKHRRQNAPQYQDKEQWARYIRAYRYGLTIEELDNFIQEHAGLCHICREREGTCIDHCHTSGKVRGMLCSQCNSLLGFASDKIEILERAIQYLMHASNESR